MIRRLIILLLIVGCGEQVREEIIERYPSGEKKIVVKYKGEGNEEKVVERTTYLESGESLLYENLIDGTSKDWAELNGLYNAENYKKYLQGTWKVIKWAIKKTDIYVEFNEDSERWVVNRMKMPHKWQWSTSDNIQSINFMDSLKLEFHPNTDSTFIYNKYTPLSDNTMREVRGIFERIDIDSIPTYKQEWLKYDGDDDDDDW